MSNTYAVVKYPIELDSYFKDSLFNSIKYYLLRPIKENPKSKVEKIFNMCYPEYGVHGYNFDIKTDTKDEQCFDRIKAIACLLRILDDTHGSKNEGIRRLSNLSEHNAKAYEYINMGTGDNFK